MRRRAWVFAGIAIAIAALFVRLGLWQLDRLAWRRAVNARVTARLAAPPVDAWALPRDTAELRYRGATARGAFEWGRELVLTSRTRNGSPGVWLVTPLRHPDRDTLLLVVRGWVYSPDGETVDLARWREGDTTVALDGFVLPLADSLGPAATLRGRDERAWRQLDVATARRVVGAPVLPVLLVQRGDSAPRAADVPPRLVPPRLDEANHQSYAIQWFSFAAMALVSAALFVRAERRRAAGGA